MMDGWSAMGGGIFAGLGVLPVLAAVMVVLVLALRRVRAEPVLRRATPGAGRG